MSVLGIMSIAIDGVQEAISGKPTIRFGGKVYQEKIDESGAVHKQAMFISTVITYNRLVTEGSEPDSFQEKADFTVVITFDTGQVYQGSPAFVSGDANSVAVEGGEQAVTITCAKLIPMGRVL